MVQAGGYYDQNVESHFNEVQIVFLQTRRWSPSPVYTTVTSVELR